jgi:hypothetical protein
MFEDTGRYHRSPINFGPAPSPRCVVVLTLLTISCFLLTPCVVGADKTQKDWLIRRGGPSLSRIQQVCAGEESPTYPKKYLGLTVSDPIDVVIEVDRAGLQALLPEGYIIDPEVSHPTVLYQVMNLRKLPWLNGRGERLQLYRLNK